VTACLRELVGPEGKVVGVELQKFLAYFALKAIQKWNESALADGSLVLLAGNALTGCCPAGYSCIALGAGCSPKDLQ
jgi:Protein-L-isoaspartate(D-aspartate) O-methyltransferase (PCMT)